MVAIKRLYYRLKFGKPIIIVSGLPRSGTSMIMQMIEAGGQQIATDNVRRADEDNPRGYYELERIKNLHKEKDKTWLRKYKGCAVKVISFLLPDLPPKLNYKIIFIQRSIEEVIISQKKMLIHYNERDVSVSDEKMKQNYELHLLKTRYLLEHTLNFETLYLGYTAVIESPIKCARSINKFLGNHLNEAAMISKVEPRLYRNRSNESERFKQYECDVLC